MHQDSYRENQMGLLSVLKYLQNAYFRLSHDDVTKSKHFPRYWSFMRGIYRSPVNSPHKGQWRRALMFSLICVWINGWVNNRKAGVLRRYRAHYHVTVMITFEQRTSVKAVPKGYCCHLSSIKCIHTPKWKCYFGEIFISPLIVTNCGTTS